MRERKINGTLKASLPLLVETDLDCVEAVTPAPVGALFSPLYSENYFKDYLKKVLKIFSLDSDFVLGVADQVPPDAKFSRITLVRRILENNDF